MNNKKRILLVEDDPNFGIILRDFLKMNEYDVVLAKNGMEGFEKFKKFEFNLCILDVMMPYKDGFTLALEIKNMSRMPLTIWAFFVTAIIGAISFPVLLSAALLLIMDRSFGTSFFLSDIFIQGEVLHYQGGSPVLFEHLFWFLGHPEVYIVLLPALGIASEVIATHARKPIFGYKAMIISILAIAFLSTIVWGHHMFVTGMNPFLGSVFTFTTLLIAIPSAVKAFNYITTLWKGNIQFNTPMLFAIGFVSTFITGGLTGIILGDSALDINVHDTYFVVAHFHLVMGISALYGLSLIHI